MGYGAENLKGYTLFFESVVYYVVYLALSSSG